MITAKECKIGYEVAWQGRRVVVTGQYPDMTLLLHDTKTLKVPNTDEVFMPKWFDRHKVVSDHYGVADDVRRIPLFGSTYVLWEELC